MIYHIQPTFSHAKCQKRLMDLNVFCLFIKDDLSGSEAE